MKVYLRYNYSTWTKNVDRLAYKLQVVLMNCRVAEQRGVREKLFSSRPGGAWNLLYPSRPPKARLFRSEG